VTAEFPESYDAGSGYRVAVTPFVEVLGERARLTLWLLMGAAAFVMACFGSLHEVVTDPADVPSATGHLNEFVLRGQKTWVTNGGPAEWYIVFALTDPARRTRGGISAFLVERDAPGMQLGPPMKKMGLRASATVDLFLEDVRVPADACLGTEGAGFAYAMKTFEASRPQVATVALGLAEGAYEYALAYAKQRHAFGRPIADFQGIQFMLADMVTQIAAARLLVYQATRMYDEGLPDLTYHASLAKLFASDTAMQVTTDAVQILGGAGYVTEHPVERMMRDAKVTQIFEGTNQIQRLLIARHILK
jgi:alkylation response protein AidB-like acyl-CoA dehydrogenase